jgi:hypothetical protein
MIQPDATNLIKITGIKTKLVGFYDAPDPTSFEPLVIPKPDKRMCIFAFYGAWQRGETLHITVDNYGCGGAANSLFNIQTRSREEFVKFLADEEGLRASHDLMNRWLDQRKPYQPQHKNIFIGPLKKDMYQYLKTVTFFVNPDQMSLLMTGAYYHSSPDDTAQVIASFGSGCMELAPALVDLETPQAVIGATDIAMRQYLPPDILAFTVTRPMFERLCSLDQKSFLYKQFWKRLQKARGLA